MSLKPFARAIVSGTLEVEEQFLTLAVREQRPDHMALVPCLAGQVETFANHFLDVAERMRPWLAPLWTVQVLTGLRPGEVYALHEADLDLDGRTARVSRTLAIDPDETGSDADYMNTPKGNRARTVDLSSEAVTVLRAHLVHRKAEKLRRGWREMPETLFSTKAGSYPDPANVRRAFAAVLKDAALPSHFTPHGLRHTFASIALPVTRDVYYVSRMLGHADIGLTVATYGSWLNPSRPGALDALDRAVPQSATEAGS